MSGAAASRPAPSNQDDEAVLGKGSPQKHAKGLSALDHVVVLLGGAIGGHLAPVIVAMVFFPHFAPKSASDLLQTFCCFPVGALVGYGPGMLVCYFCVGKKGGRWLAALAASMTSVAVHGYITYVVFGATAR